LAKRLAALRLGVLGPIQDISIVRACDLNVVTEPFEVALRKFEGSEVDAFTLAPVICAQRLNGRPLVGCSERETDGFRHPLCHHRARSYYAASGTARILARAKLRRASIVLSASEPERLPKGRRLFALGDLDEYADLSWRHWQPIELPVQGVARRDKSDGGEIISAPSSDEPFGWCARW
jgi:hypothetical protein